MLWPPKAVASTCRSTSAMPRLRHQCEAMAIAIGSCGFMIDTNMQCMSVQCRPDMSKATTCATQHLSCLQPN
eukprot:4205666-Alexandrium_andersonii.AAC.1